MFRAVYRAVCGGGAGGILKKRGNEAGGKWYVSQRAGYAAGAVFGG